MIVSAKLGKAIRENFPGVNNAGVRKEIRDRIVDGLDPIHLKSKIAFSYSGLESLKAVQKVFEEETKPNMADVIEHVYTVRDASGEYLAANGKRTPASNEAMEFESRDAALVACERATDKVISRDAE